MLIEHSVLVEIPPGGILPNSNFAETQLGPEGLNYLWYLNANFELWQGNFNDVLDVSAIKVDLENSTFPYSRMAPYSLVYIVDTDTWLYHQINGSFFCRRAFPFYNRVLDNLAH